MQHLDLQLSPEEKLKMYHFIIDTIKANEPRQASTLIVAKFQQLLAEMEEKAMMIEDGVFSEDKGKMFRRIG